uniref:Aquaporin 9 n=1 Tax=Ursus americanus TaxID=9643 RepID=A0A452RA15_URSAM
MVKFLLLSSSSSSFIFIIIIIIIIITFCSQLCPHPKGFLCTNSPWPAANIPNHLLFLAGGHINPAVSFAMCLFGRMKWFKFPFYVGAQFLGAFVGAATLFGVYYDGLMAFAGGKLLIVGENATAHIFATYPAPYLSLTNAFADQVVATMFLLMVVFAIFDSRNLGVPRGLEPIAIGLLIIVIASSLGLNSGCAMNPARDLSPRLFTALAGWGFEVFTAGNNFWWIPVVGPMVGAAIGGLIYVLVIEIHHPDPEPDFETEQSEDKLDKYELKQLDK